MLNINTYCSGMLNNFSAVLYTFNELYTIDMQIIFLLNHGWNYSKRYLNKIVFFLK